MATGNHTLHQNEVVYAESLVVNGNALSGTEFGYVDGVTPGTGVASKALILDSSGNVAMPAAGMFGMSRAALAAAGADAGTAAVIATQIVAVTASDGAKGVALPAAATTTGPILVINTVTTANLLVYPVSGGNDLINGLAEDLPFTMGPGKAAWFIPTSATQWYAMDASGVLATTDEINRIADVSTRVVTIVASGAVTVAANGDKINLLGEVGGNALCAMTLPAATGSGARFEFTVSVVNTSTYTITTNGSDVYRGTVIAHDRDITDGTLLHAFASTAATIITLNGGTTGGQIGDKIVIEDILTGVWSVSGVVAVPTGSNPATMFS